MKDLLFFYNYILARKRFYLPVLLYAVVGYSFSIYNRTVNIDDLMREFNIGSGNRMLSGRWGFIIWNKLFGINAVYDPFIDRFLAIILLITAAILLCYILYTIGGEKRVIPYTLTASMFVSYPLFNEIWYYTGANWVVTGNICLVSLAILISRSSLQFGYKTLYASLLLILPVSSYETSVFYYVTLICIVLYYEYIQKGYEIVELLKKCGCYFSSLILAIVYRFLISSLINSYLGLQYTGGGATGIKWTEDSFFHVIKCVVGFNIVNYGLSALVYLPVFVFLLMSLIFFLHFLLPMENKGTKFFLGGVIFLSLFSQSLLQGIELSYRHAQTLILFVSFVTYQLCLMYNTEKRRIIVYCCLFVLCWHQAVYINRLNGLNDLRSNNETALIHQIGSRLVSEFESKPVVFVGSYQMGKYITDHVSVDESTWNGRLYYLIYDNLLAKVERPHKYISSNVNSATADHHQVQQLFNYFGYDIKTPYQFKGNVEEFTEETKIMEDEANQIVREKGIKPYHIYDNGEYIIVNLGGVNI